MLAVTCGEEDSQLVQCVMRPYLPPKESYCQEACKCACGACTAFQVQRRVPSACEEE